MIDGAVHHFSGGGLYDGLILLCDDETETYWDHITGEALHGPLKGHVLETFPIEQTTVAAALAADPGLAFTPSRASGKKYDELMAMWPRIQEGWLPPGFRETMGEPDPRLPELAPGLGVVIDGVARFYPRALLAEGAVEERHGDRRLVVSLGADDGVARARFEDGEVPFQLQSRWYGFAYSYPGCEVATREG